MKLPRLSLRDYFWLTLASALAIGWAVERQDRALRILFWAFEYEVRNSLVFSVVLCIPLIVTAGFVGFAIGARRFNEVHLGLLLALVILSGIFSIAMLVIHTNWLL
jgi:hypothetical protein